jgi:hypothetical protein
VLRRVAKLEGRDTKDAMETRRNSDRNLLLRHFVHYESAIKSAEIEPEAPHIEEAPYHLCNYYSLIIHATL